MKEELRGGALNDACLELAKRLLWSQSGKSADVLETFAARLQAEALLHREYVEGQGRDPNLITRAVHYLAEAHAIPPMGTDLIWFSTMLACLVELAVPNGALSESGRSFLNDVQRGLAISL